MALLSIYPFEFYCLILFGWIDNSAGKVPAVRLGHMHQKIHFRREVNLCQVSTAFVRSISFEEVTKITCNQS